MIALHKNIVCYGVDVYTVDLQIKMFAFFIFV